MQASLSPQSVPFFHIQTYGSRVPETHTMSPSTIEDFSQQIPEQPQTSHKSADLLKHTPDESVLTEKDRAELVFTDKHSAPDVFISGQDDTCWHPWTGTLELKPLRFETRSGTFVVALRTPVDAWLGKHRHRGPVTAVTVSGNWRYKE